MMDELLRAGILTYGNFKININDLPEDAWNYLVGGPDQSPNLRKYFKSVAWLNRGVKLRKQAVQSLPFSIKKGDDVVDQSNDYENILGFLPNPRRLFGVIEQSLTMNGKAYLFKKRKGILSKAIVDGFQYLVPSSIKPEFSKDNGELLGFIRTVNNKTLPLDVEDVLYFWPTDDSVEIGPPQDWPALAALQAAGVLYAVDGFATTFFERGAIKITLIGLGGTTTPAEKDRTKNWWERVKKKAWSSEIINADKVTVTPVGEGLESLTNTNLTTEKREDIATALGVPHSMLFSNAANYATSVQDKQNWYEDTVIPDGEFIQDIFNEQLLNPLGYQLEFEPQSMDIFQEDEEQRAGAFSSYVGAQIRPSIVGEMLGLELPEGVEYAALDEKFDKGLEMADKMAMAQAQQPIPPGKEKSPIKEEEQPNKSLQDIDLEKWERKATKRIKDGKVPACSFESEHIPAVIVGAIEGALEAAQTAEDVRAVFSDVWKGYP